MLWFSALEVEHGLVVVVGGVVDYLLLLFLDSVDCTLYVEVVDIAYEEKQPLIGQYISQSAGTSSC